MHVPISIALILIGWVLFRMYGDPEPTVHNVADEVGLSLVLAGLGGLLVCGINGIIGVMS